MPIESAEQPSLQETHAAVLSRERTRHEVGEPQLPTWKAPLPSCPPWMPKKVWKRLFFANGSRLFAEVWRGKATESGVRVLCNRAICCGFNKAECRQLVLEWLGAKDPDLGWLIHEFDRQYDLALHYLESHGVLERLRDRDRQDFVRAASTTANRILVLLADNTGAKRETLQSELGLTRDNLKKHLARLRAVKLANQVGGGRYALTETGEQHVASLLAVARAVA